MAEADKVVAQVEEFIEQAPLPLKNSNWGEDYTFPNLSELSSAELSTLLSNLAGWSGYAIRLMMKVGIAKDIMEDTLSAKIAKNTVTIMIKYPKATKDFVLGKILTEDIEAIELKTKLISKNAELEALRRLTSLYELQLNAVSREVSRRSLDIKQGF